MDVKELLFDYQTFVSLAIFLLSLGALYWNLKIDMTKITLSIEEIKTDREKKWREQGAKCSLRKTEYDKNIERQSEREEKLEAYISDVLKAVTNLDLKTERIANDIAWLKKGK